MLILGLFSVVVVCVCFVMLIGNRTKIIITQFAMREFLIFKFSGYNLEYMKKILWKYSIQTLKIADSVLLNLFMKDNSRCVISHAT